MQKNFLSYDSGDGVYNAELAGLFDKNYDADRNESIAVHEMLPTKLEGQASDEHLFEIPKSIGKTM